MWKQEKSKDAIYFWRNILIWYFSGHKEYRTMSSIWKAAYESALRDSMKDCMWYQGYKEWYIKNGNNLQIFRQNMFDDLERKKHCQRHNGPEGWVHLTKATPLYYISSSKTNLGQISSSESRPSINFKISIKHQHLD